MQSISYAVYTARKRLELQTIRVDWDCLYLDVGILMPASTLVVFGKRGSHCFSPITLPNHPALPGKHTSTFTISDR